MSGYGQQGKTLLSEAYNSSSELVTATAVQLDSGWGYPNSEGASAVPPPAIQTATAYIPNTNSGYNGMPSNNYSGIGQAFFLDYADTVKKINSLNYVDQAINDVNNKIAQSQNVISQTKAKLAKANADQPKLEARIHRNENPRFFHYMQVGRKEKVDKLKHELENMIQWEERWAADKQNAEHALAQQSQELATLQNTRANKSQLEGKRNKMYEQAIASVPPTARLTQIDTNINAQSTNIQFENGLHQNVDSCMGLIQQALQLYGQSIGMLQQAAQANRTAQTMNTFDMIDGRPGGGDFFETMNQAQRDRLINEAQVPAIRAYQVISQAWQIFPEEARRRYPSLAAQIGHAPLPQLRGANFGNTLMTGMVFGDIGDMVNNSRARGKIQENMAIIQQCIQIMNQQLALVQALRNAISSNIAQMENQMNVLKGQRKEERDNIFENVKRSALSGMPPPAMGVAY